MLRTLIAVAVLVGLATLAWVAFDETEPPPPPRASPVADLAVETQADNSSVPVALAASAPIEAVPLTPLDETSEDLEAGATLLDDPVRVLVLDDRGAPVANALVRLIGDLPPSFEAWGHAVEARFQTTLGKTQQFSQDRTDDCGVAQMEAVRGDAAIEVWLPHAASSGVPFRQKAGPGRSHTVKLPASSVIAGVVREGGREPRRRLRVALWADNGTNFTIDADTSGAFKFIGLPPQTCGKLSVIDAPTWMARGAPPETARVCAPTTDAIVALPGRILVTGRLVDGGSGAPSRIPARIEWAAAQGEPDVMPADADGDGRFQFFLSAPAKGTLRVLDSEGGWHERAQFAITERIAVDTDIGAISVPCEREVEFFTLDPAGSPIADAIATWNPNRASPKTGGNGRAVAKLFRPEKCRIAAPGFTATTVELSPDTSKPFIVTLEPVASLKIRLHAPGGDPPPGSLIVEFRDPDKTAALAEANFGTRWDDLSFTQPYVKNELVVFGLKGAAKFRVIVRGSAVGEVVATQLIDVKPGEYRTLDLSVPAPRRLRILAEVCPAAVVSLPVVEVKPAGAEPDAWCRLSQDDPDGFVVERFFAETIDIRITSPGCGNLLKNAVTVPENGRPLSFKLVDDE